MAENTQGNIDPVEVTQDPAMPTGEQQVPEAGQVDNGAVQSQSEATPQQTPDEGLPEQVSERTREQFDRLTEQLRTERARREKLETTFRALQPKAPAQPEPIMDPYTGQVDPRMTEINQRAWQAEQRAVQAEQAISNFYTEQQTREALVAHPELDSTSKSFDKQFHIATRALLMDSMVNPGDYGDEQLTYKEAADRAKELRKVQVDQVRKQAASEAIEQLSPKEQATLEATGNPTRRNEVNDSLPDLQQKTRKGDLDAIVSRMRGITAVGKG